MTPSIIKKSEQNILPEKARPFSCRTILLLLFACFIFTSSGCTNQDKYDAKSKNSNSNSSGQKMDLSPEENLRLGAEKIRKKNYKQAFIYFKNAADAELPAGQYNLAIQYYRGAGVERDFDKARELFEKAAARNYAKASNNLGVMYRQGQGVEVDLEQARVWFSKAASQGNEKARRNLARIKNTESFLNDPVWKECQSCLEECGSRTIPNCQKKYGQDIGNCKDWAECIPLCTPSKYSGHGITDERSSYLIKKLDEITSNVKKQYLKK